MKYVAEPTEGLFRIYDIGRILNISIAELFRMRENLSIAPALKKGNTQFYRVEQFQFHSIYKYYPMKTTETFHIYESKMNANN